MKQNIKRILTLLIILSVLCTGSAPIYAMNVSGQSDKESDYVLIYHDIETGIDTKITAAEAKFRFGLDIDKQMRTISTKPQKPTIELTEKHLTEQEIQEVEKANINGINYFNNMISLEPPLTQNSEILSKTNSIQRSSGETRTVVTDLHKYPYYCNAKLYSGDRWIGSGFAIGKNLLATARHCLQNSDGWASSVKAYFGFDNNVNTYIYKAENPVGYIVCPAETMTETLEDWAFVVWDKDIINYTGCYGLTGAGYNGMPVKTIGYPQDLNGGNKMYESSGTITNCRDYDFDCDLRVYYGQSGSAVYEEGVDGAYAIAIVTHSSFPVNGTNNALARRIDSSLIGWFFDNGYFD